MLSHRTKQKLAPEYEAAAIELKAKDPAVRLAKVNYEQSVERLF